MASSVSESEIEYGLIGRLQDLKYTYRKDIRDRKALELNFRKKFEALNKVSLTDSEFERLKDKIIQPDVFLSSKLIRQKNDFIREDGTPLAFTLVNIKDWCKNEFEVINQLRVNSQNSSHRYDVLLLINGIPVVQIELKTLQISPRRAMQQIVDYKSDPGNGYTNSLLCFVQLFVVSNRKETYYFTNNKNQHFIFNADEQYLPVYQWAKPDNKKVTNIDDFAEEFLAKCKLAEMISKYMVLVEVEQKLLIMRPYQIYAVKAILNSITENRGNGYIWHTTGSGKTLTSFKASTLLKDNPDIAKCLFVVDRKDLDRQTREEFNRFQKDCVEENTHTSTLVRRMLSDDHANKVIVTTIQKLGLALDPNNPKNYKEKLAPLSKKRLVFIFDECHRSQFGDNHKAIKEFFPHAQLFGFTGTPIFEENANYKQIDGTVGSYVTTKDIFQNELPKYTITNAIEDQNVLRFHVDYFKRDGKNLPTVNDPATKQAIIEAILEKHEAATNFRKFNAFLATNSINDAIEYYHLFKAIQAQRSATDEDYRPLNIACVFSPPAEGNKDVQQIQEDLPNEKADNQVAPEEKKLALKGIINDYNEQYGTNHSIGEFDKYYQDVQQRIKDQKYPNSDVPHSKKIDLVIVVDMLLTGFDSKYLNTLYVDKNLKYHGLIQAFSRTNRILNGSKPHGQVMDFRGQQKNVEDAIALFSGGDMDKAKEIWLAEPAPKVFEKFGKALEELNNLMKSHGVECKAEEVANLKGDIARAQFIEKFKEVQRLKTQLDQYTDLTPEIKEQIESTLPEEELRSFKSAYLETARRLKGKQDEGGKDTPPEVDALDFNLVLFASAVVDYDYIMNLIAKYTQNKPSKQKMTREQLINLLSSSANLMDEREDITEYINSLQVGKGLNVEEIKAGYERFKKDKSEKVLRAIADTHGLDFEALQDFVSAILNRMIFDGDQLSELLAPLELGWKDRTKKELALMEQLGPYLKKLAHGREISGLAAYE
ncbi:type I restriction endonuclease subunit R [Algoriphagus marincola]|uniref:type I restriction endonuclease subunit R n=1 Tax=Algoriphagus marincola TaxID=264027 RepID=UPI00041CAD9B|nr:type I restriction endonuclease subunit R [Algoriphagus marincola]